MPKFILQDTATLLYYKSSGVSENLSCLRVTWEEDIEKSFHFGDQQAAVMVSGMISRYFPELNLDVSSLNLLLYTGRLTQLHSLMAKGEGDSEEADKIRDSMDSPQLDSQEQELVKNLSGDLYKLQGEGMYIKVPEEEKPAKRAELERMIILQKWPEVLALLKQSLGLSEKEVATRRAIAWGSIDPRVGRLFHKYAEGL
jgi:hypothetical protein